MSAEVKHLKEPIANIVHLEGVLGSGYVLCGASSDGVNGDEPFTETHEGIDCSQCIATINHCRKVRGGDIKPAFKRRRQ